MRTKMLLNTKREESIFSHNVLVVTEESPSFIITNNIDWVLCARPSFLYSYRYPSRFNGHTETQSWSNKPKVTANDEATIWTLAIQAQMPRSCPGLPAGPRPGNCSVPRQRRPLLQGPKGEQGRAVLSAWVGEARVSSGAQSGWRKAFRDNVCLGFILNGGKEFSKFVWLGMLRKGRLAHSGENASQTKDIWKRMFWACRR